MNVNKKLDRFKQWAGERMGGEAKTGVSDDFKSLELEMTLRHEGNIHTTSACPGTDCMNRYGTVTEIDDRLRQNSLQTQ
jgi:hypothetical protein